MTEDLREINRKISEVKYGSLSRMRRIRTMKKQRIAPGWTGDETANAELLEEMPDDLELMRHAVGSTRWYQITVNRFSSRAIQVTDKDRKTAIALAYLAWKGSK